MASYDCVIVGAGIHGLCTAFWLARRGMRRIAVLEQHEARHSHGSSHGETRITRTSYDDPRFVALAQVAHRDGWPVFEQELAQRLLLPTPGVFFGPADGLLRDHRAAAAGAKTLVAAMPVDEARARFPLLRFEDGDGVLLDRSAAVVLAAVTMQALREWLLQRGVELHWRTPALALRPSGSALEVATPNGAHAAHHVVLACGAWSGRLHALGVPTLVVQRQEVGYFDVAAAPGLCAPGAFPVWVRVGRTPEDCSYGLPSWNGSGLKAALHRTTGKGASPDGEAPAIDAAALLALARARFTCEVRGLAASERCLYTMAERHELHVVRAPDLPLTTIAACSGHAFKFGPLIGRMAADQVAT